MQALHGCVNIPGQELLGPVPPIKTGTCTQLCRNLCLSAVYTYMYMYNHVIFAKSKAAGQSLSMFDGLLHVQKVSVHIHNVKCQICRL